MPTGSQSVHAQHRGSIADAIGNVSCLAVANSRARHQTIAVRKKPRIFALCGPEVSFIGLVRDQRNHDSASNTFLYNLFPQTANRVITLQEVTKAMSQQLSHDKIHLVTSSR